MWSEYLRMIAASRQRDRNSSWPVAQVQRDLGAALRRASTRSIVYSPSPVDSQRTPSAAGSPARRVTSVTRSATMNDE